MGRGRPCAGCSGAGRRDGVSESMLTASSARRCGRRERVDGGRGFHHRSSTPARSRCAPRPGPAGRARGRRRLRRACRSRSRAVARRGHHETAPGRRSVPAAAGAGGDAWSVGRLSAVTTVLGEIRVSRLGVGSTRSRPDRFLAGKAYSSAAHRLRPAGTAVMTTDPAWRSWYRCRSGSRPSRQVTTRRRRGSDR